MKKKEVWVIGIMGAIILGAIILGGKIGLGVGIFMAASIAIFFVVLGD
jgi:hypothetical protein